MRLLGELQSRGARLGLVGLVAGVLIYAGLQLSGALGGRDTREAREQDLADAQLMSTMAPVITDAHMSFQGDVGMVGSPLPGAVVERLKEAYTLDAEPDKTRLGAASVTALAGKLTIDAGSAEFIVEAGDLEDWDALAARKRSLFDENRATLQALVYSEISKVAAESGIDKLDSVKVEAPRAVRGRSARAAKPKAPKPNPNSLRELRDHISAATEAIESADDLALGDALAAAVSLAEVDPSIRRTARAGLEGLLDKDDLSDAQSARIRLAALGSQPDLMRATRQMLGAHLDDALAAVPEPPAPPSDEEPDGSEGDGGDEQPTAEDGAPDNETTVAQAEDVDREQIAAEDEIPAGERDGDEQIAAEDEVPAGERDGDEQIAAEGEVPAGERDGDEQTAAEVDDGDGDGADVDESVQHDQGEDVDAVAGSDEAPGDDDEGAAEAAPAYSDDPVTFHAEPFPALPVLPASAQRRLLAALKDAGGAWLTDAQLDTALAVPEPAEEDNDAAEEAVDDADAINGDDSGTPTEGDATTADTVNVDEGETENPDAAAEQDNDLDRSDASELVDGGRQGDADASKADSDDEGENAEPDASDEQDGDAADTGDGSDVVGDGEDAVPAHPDAPVAHAYQVELVDAMWQVAALLQRTRAAAGKKYTANLQFKAPLDQLVNFVHKLETQKPWIRVTELRIGIDNADQPMLSLTLSLEATIL